MSAAQNGDTGTIVDDDSSIHFVTATQSTNENTGNPGNVVNVLIVRDGSTAFPVNANVQFFSGTAIGGPGPCTAFAGPDYIDPGIVNVIFPGGVSQQQVPITICDDSLFEPTETFTGQLSGPTGQGATIGSPSTTTISIIDNDTAPVFTVNSPSANEGSPLAFVITRTGLAQANSVVCYNTADGTAIAPGDYVALANNATNCATFTLAGPNTANVSVTTNQDLLVEPTETMQLVINSVTNGTGVGNAGTGSIIDDDSNFTIVANPTSGLENITPANFTVTRTTGGGAPITAANVDVATFNGPGGQAFGGASCATPGVDYITSGATYTFPAGGPAVQSQQFTVAICDDTLNEPNETFNANLSNAIGGNLGSPSTATYTIIDNDAAPNFQATAAASQSEGTTPYVVTVTRSGNASSQTSTLTYTTTSGTATGGAA